VDVAARERKTVELDWSDFPVRCPDKRDLPADDPRSAEAVQERARERALQAIGPQLADGWELDGTPADAIAFERRKRRVLLPTPDSPGAQWEEYCAAVVKLRRG
jgi:hypothetical protein